MEGEYESANIHTKWLENIYEQLKNIQTMERLASEGCSTLEEYFQIPFHLQRVVIPDAQYKNLRFIILEMRLLISNLSPVLNERVQYYKEKLNPILKVKDKRELFLKEVKVNNQLNSIEILPFMTSTLEVLFFIKSMIIKDIGPILYIKEEEPNKKKW